MEVIRYNKGTEVIYYERFADVFYKSISIIDTPTDATLYKDLLLKERYGKDNNIWPQWKNGIIAISYEIENVIELKKNLYDIDTDTGITIFRLEIVS